MKKLFFFIIFFFSSNLVFAKDVTFRCGLKNSAILLVEIDSQVVDLEKSNLFTKGHFAKVTFIQDNNPEFNLGIKDQTYRAFSSPLESTLDDILFDLKIVFFENENYWMAPNTITIFKDRASLFVSQSYNDRVFKLNCKRTL